MHDPGGTHVHQLDLESTPPGTIRSYWLHLVNNSIGEPIRIPVLVARGVADGPVFGLTAAIHGNELNGIPVIQRVFSDLDATQLRGTLVGALVMNVPGLLREQRQFNDGQDLNRLAPGRADGTTSQVYVHRLLQRIIRKFDLHIDLHTASFGRINSHYVRANMHDAGTARLARLQNAQIVVHNEPNDTTLRGAASALGIRSITIELRDPHVFQDAVVEDGTIGIRNVLYDLGMLEGKVVARGQNTILCRRSHWLYTDEGGILRVIPSVLQPVARGELIAEVRTIFGHLRKQYFAPEDGIVVGRNVNPLNQTGSRILHLGLEPEPLPPL